MSAKGFDGFLAPGEGVQAGIWSLPVTLRSLSRKKLVSFGSQIVHTPSSSPALPAGFTLRWHRLLPLAVCLLLCQCAHSKKSARESEGTAWYYASDHPPTYCPKGYSLPKPGSPEAARAEYIQKPDRPTRYYVPEGCVAHRRLAMQLSGRPGVGHCVGVAALESAEFLAESIFCVVSFPYYLMDWYVQRSLELNREERRKNEVRDAQRGGKVDAG